MISCPVCEREVTDINDTYESFSDEEIWVSMGCECGATLKVTYTPSKIEEVGE